uniref:G_PROTEIN_RECEP_F1_2 domain-containing protein n=2 Tax=Caenorhabditis tropicalis TaxID=1561998 RepID=A0A1I7T2T6_9PELO
MSGNNTEFLPSIDFGFTKYLVVSSMLIFSFSYLILPFYLHIFQLNRKRDETIPTVYASQTIFVVICTLLYLPIMRSIQKLGHLASAQLNKPQRYVLWQLVAVFIGKIALVPFILFFHTNESVPFNSMKLTMVKMVDGFFTPIIIQITYLGCNRRNLTALLASLTRKCFPDNYVSKGAEGGTGAGRSGIHCRLST